MGLFSSKPKIVDPYNTMGGAPQGRSQRPSVSELSNTSVKDVARRYGLTLKAAERFRDLYDEARTYGATERGHRASVGCDDILRNPGNRKRW
jgi:hypothetical protein